MICPHGWLKKDDCSSCREDGWNTWFAPWWVWLIVILAWAVVFGIRVYYWEAP